MNQIILMGRLGNDPESKYYGDEGKQKAEFSLAVDSGYGDRKQTTWFNCTAFGKTAEVVMKYLAKGRKVLVIGEMKCRKWEEKYYWSVLVNRIEFADSGNREGGSGEQQNIGFGS